ncbi:MAG: zinc ribbon domain-containing protein [Candidatus Heimdallarchaeaceae archaeon]
MGRKLVYWNGFAVVMLVFAIIALIPLTGLITSLAVSEGQLNYSELQIPAGESEVISLDSTYTTLVSYYMAHSSPNVSSYLLSADQYSTWNKTLNAPTDFVKQFSSRKLLTVIRSNTSEYFVIYNGGSDSLYVNLLILGAPNEMFVSTVIFSVLFTFFTTMLLLHTVGFILNALIFNPISGSGRYDDRKRSVSQIKLDAHKGELVNINGKYYYRYTESPTTSNSVSSSSKTPSTFVSSSETETSTLPSADTMKQLPVKERRPATEAVSLTGVRSKTPPFRPHKYRIVAFLDQVWITAALAEKILVIIALFFLTIGIFTGTWFLYFTMPVVLLGSALIVYHANKTRREKIINIIEANRALYIDEIASHLRSSSEIIRSDVWKIIHLGLADIAYDVSKDIVYAPSLVSSKKPTTASLAKEEMPPALSEILCPFCEARNPADSAFCIKCGASLQPVK